MDPSSSEKKMATRKKNESSFESSLKELEEVVQSLESSQVNLEEHLKLYEKGVTLIHLCQSTLKDAEKRIELLTGVDESGNARLEKFGHESTVKKEEKGLFSMED